MQVGKNRKTFLSEYIHQGYHPIAMHAALLHLLISLSVSFDAFCTVNMQHTRRFDLCRLSESF